MKVYIAASSAELPRARLWRDRCVAAGIEVVSSWIENVTKVGEANPRDATREQRREWTYQCLREIQLADRFWLLWPERPSAALVEFGFVAGRWTSFALDVFISGDTKRSIFCALGREYATDEEAFAALVDEAKR